MTSVGGGEVSRTLGFCRVAWGSNGAERIEPSTRQKVNVSSNVRLQAGQLFIQHSPGNLSCHLLLFLSGINIKHHDDNEQENYFQQREVSRIEAPRFVVCVPVDDERGER